jgi:UPF0716 family protein affecting phage T7 exclusion
MVVYTAYRFGLFLLCLVVFYAAGLGLLLSLALAAVVSGVAGYFLLARQRLALGAAVDERITAGRRRAAERTAREDAIADELLAEQDKHHD